MTYAYRYRYPTSEWENPSYLSRVKNVAYEKRSDYVTIFTEDSLSAVCVEALLERFVIGFGGNYEYKANDGQWYDRDILR